MDLNALLAAEGGVIASREHRRARRALSRAAAAGRLHRVFRGIYVAAESRDDPVMLVRAVQTAFPDAIFTGMTAAWLNGQLERPPRRITAVHHRRPMRSERVRLGRARLDDALWLERADGLRVMTQIMTALDVVPALGARLIDQLLRKTRDVTALMRRLRSCLSASPNRPGNQRRRLLLQRSTTNPWSEAERKLHDLLDAAGVSGWLANHAVTVNGQRAFLDLAFPGHFLAVEVDGYEFHSDRGAFIRDRRRGNLLLLDGWQVLHFTWDDLTDHPSLVVSQILAALKQYTGRTWQPGVR